MYENQILSACTQDHIHKTQPLMPTKHTEITCGKVESKNGEELDSNQFYSIYSTEENNKRTSIKQNIKE